MKSYDLISCCKEWLEDYVSLCSHKNISIQLEYNQSSIFFSFDCEKLELVMSNLISNAYKYTPEGGKIIISLESNDSEVVISVIDNGIGIKSDDLKNIFEPYFRGNATPEAGFGLGLCFVKNIVEVMNGRIEVKSEVNRGSKFDIIIPKIEYYEHNCLSSSIDNTTIEMEEELPIIQTSTATELILVIDDERETLNILQRYLTSNYRVMVVDNAIEGLKLTETYRPDIIICDIMMKGMDGYEFLKTIKQDDKLKSIPIIMFTAKSIQRNEVDAYKYGADAYITKPVSLEYLKTRINNLIEKKKSGRVLAVTEAKVDSDTNYSSEEKLFIIK